jgi:hypothetical protein
MDRIWTWILPSSGTSIEKDGKMVGSGEPPKNSVNGFSLNFLTIYAVFHENLTDFSFLSIKGEYAEPLHMLWFPFV